MIRIPANGYKIMVGNSLDTMRLLGRESINCCITSPPYFGLRDYGVDGQIGLENSALNFVSSLVEVFELVNTILRKDGVLFVNIGDTFAGFKDGKFPPQSKANGNQRDMPKTGAPHRNKKLLQADGFKNKELMGIPWRFAFAMQAAGWYLRQDIIWSKPNYTPEKVRDRFVKSHEHIFLFTKHDKYWFDGDAVRIPSLEGDKLRNDVWTIPTSSFKGSHFATFPPELVEPCVLSGCPKGGIVLDPFGGTGTVAGVAVKHKRRAIICELNPDFAKLIPSRVESIIK